MFVIKTSNRIPMNYMQAGNLLSVDRFLHSKRCLHHFVLLVGLEGSVSISQDNVEYILEPGKFLILLPEHTHQGTRETIGKLSYYWAHFTVNSGYEVLTEEEAEQFICNSDLQDKNDVILLPIYGSFSNINRIMLEFRQLIDFSMQNVYSASMMDFAVSILLMDLTHEYLQNNQQKTMNRSACSLVDIKEYIRVYFDHDLSVTTLADMFGYNPNYLSTVFKKSMGMSLSHYINQCRISVAKSLLLDSGDTITEIASKVGYNDSKYFIRVFRQYEGMTPMVFRNVFFRKYVNRD